MPDLSLVASEQSGGIVNSLNPLNLLITLAVLFILGMIVRSIIRGRTHPKTVLQRGKFPVVSIVLLSISLVLLITGNVISFFLNDAIGGAIATLSGFVGMYESRRRHKREGHPDPPLRASGKS